MGAAGPIREPPVLFTRPPRPSLGARVRAWFLTGIVVAGPVAVTGYIAWWFVNTVDNMVKPLVPARFWPDAYLPVYVPGFGVVIAFLALTLLGFFTANLVGRSLIALGEGLLDRMPIVRGIYKSVKQIFETMFSQSGTGFRRVALVEYPMPGWWSVVFLSAEPSETVAQALPGTPALVSVFLPCAPNPTTGFYFYLPAHKVIEIDVTPDDAVKLIMSAGLIQPHGQAMLAAMAEGAKRVDER